MLHRIQKQIEDTYRIVCPASAGDFVLAEKSRGRFLEKMPWLSATEEALLIRESGEAVDVGLWFHPSVLRRSRRTRWGRRVLQDRQAVLPLVEGVSHFVYFLWRAERKEPVTQLELEIQAEVDKFVLLAPWTGPDQMRELPDELFSKVAWRPGLEESARERYETAAKLALKYCHFLRREYLEPERPQALASELRSFYRMGQSEKIRRIHS